MSTNTLEQLKQAKSALEAERKPVSHVQEALKVTKDITQFVKIALSKENRRIFQAGDRKVAIGELGARGFDHLHEMGPLLRLNRTTDVAFGAICIDQSLALGVEDDHPRDATLAGPT